MGNVFKVKHGLSQPSKTDLKEYELGYCTADGRLYINSSFTTDSNESDSSNQANSIKIDINDILTYDTNGKVKTVGVIPVENIYGKIPAEKISGVIPIDIRLKVVQLFRENVSREILSKIYNVSPSSISRWNKMFDGTIESLKNRSG